MAFIQNIFHHFGRHFEHFFCETQDPQKALGFAKTFPTNLS